MLVGMISCYRVFLFLSSIAPFAAKNNLSINVYGVEDDKKVIYPLCVTDSVVPGRHVDLLLHECNGDQQYSTIKNFSRLISSQLSNQIPSRPKMSFYQHPEAVVSTLCSMRISSQF